MSDNNDEFGAFLVGFIVGGLTGAVVALLFAPQSGEETRALIKDKSIELRDKAQHTAEEALAHAEQAAADARARAEELAKVARTRAEELAAEVRTRGTEAYSVAKERGQAIYEDVRERGKTVIEASHMCMQMRGVQKQNSVTTTSAFTGAFLRTATREEFTHLIGNKLH